MPTPKKKSKKADDSKAARNQVRVSDIPDDLFKKITKNAEAEDRTLGREVLVFLKKHY